MIGVSHHRGLTCLTLDNAAANNVLTLDLVHQMTKTLQQLPSDTRALVLRSSGSVFSYGLNLTKAVEGDGDAATGSRSYSLLLDALHCLPVPSLALVQGPCKAGGVGLVAACDLVLCHERASFQLSEALLGLLPANVSPYLVRRTGEQHVLRWTLTLEEVDAKAAFRAGLVDYLVEDDDKLDKLTRRIVKQIFRCSPRALAMMKTFLREGRGEDWPRQRARAENLLTPLLADEQNRAAMSALQRGELPPWSETFRSDSRLALEVGR